MTLMTALRSAYFTDSYFQCHRASMEGRTDAVIAPLKILIAQMLRIMLWAAIIMSLDIIASGSGKCLFEVCRTFFDSSLRPVWTGVCDGAVVDSLDQKWQFRMYAVR